MNAESISLIIGIIVGILGVIFGYIGLRSDKEKDDKSEGKEGGVILTEIGYIKSGVDDIKRKQEKQDENHVLVVQRLAKVEDSTKAAHKRLDTIEEKISSTNN